MKRWTPNVVFSIRFVSLWRSVQHLAFVALRYLPLVLMGLLALLSYGLVRNIPETTLLLVERQPTHDADYTMSQVVMQSYGPKGDLTNRISAAKWSHFPDTDTAEMLQPEIRIFKQGALETHVSAEKGSSNADGSALHLLGDVTVQRRSSAQEKAPAQLKTESLLLDTKLEKLSTSVRVDIVQGSDTARANHMAYDHVAQLLVLSGGVHMQIWPNDKRDKPRPLSR